MNVNCVALTLPLLVRLLLPLLVPLILFLGSVASPLLHSVASFRCHFGRPLYIPPISSNGGTSGTSIYGKSTPFETSNETSNGLATGTHTPSLVVRKDQCMRGAFHGFTQTVVGSSLYGH
jgi:hypothetical protein